jgi:V8-like Glu-specific endopeptidase
MNRSSLFKSTAFVFLITVSLAVPACDTGSETSAPAGDPMDTEYPLPIDNPAAHLDFDPEEYEPMVAPEPRVRTPKEPSAGAELKAPSTTFFDVRTQQFIKSTASETRKIVSAGVNGDFETDLEQRSLRRPLSAGPPAATSGEAWRGTMVKKDLERAGLSIDDPEALEKLEQLEELADRSKAGLSGAAAIGARGDTTVFNGRTTVKLFITYTTGYKSWCSGKLIGSRTVMTAGHCLNLGWKDGVFVGLVAASIRAVPGSDGTYMPYGDANATGWVIDQEWIDASDHNYDWAMVYLDRDIGNTTGWFGMWSATDSALSDLHVDMWGYPSSLSSSGQIMGNSTGNVNCVDPYEVHATYVSVGGFSGAGAHAQSGTHKHQLYGVHRGETVNGWCSLSTMKGAVRFYEARRQWYLAHMNQSTPRPGGSMAGWAPLGGAANMPISAVSWGPDRNDIFVRGLTNAVHHRAQVGNAFFPADWEFQGGETVGKVAVASRQPDVLDVFVRAYANPSDICTKSWVSTEWRPSLTTWTCFSDTKIKGSPTAVSTRHDRLHVFGRNSSGAVLEKPWTGQSGWTAPINLGANTDRDVAVESRAEWRWDAFIRDKGTEKLCTKSRNGGSLWPTGTGWHCFDGTNVGPEPTVVSSGANSLDVFYVDTLGGVFHMRWRGAAWEGPFSLGGLTNGSVAAVSRHGGQVDIFVVGLDGQVYTKAKNDASAWFPSDLGWHPLGGDMLDVTATSSGASRIDLYARDRALQPHHRFWNGSGWSQ